MADYNYPPESSKKRRLSEPLEEDEDKKGGAGGADVKESKGGASEFVKKLYRMLEDANFAEIVSWGYGGDSFVVKDMNSFTRMILPLHFKHSNFASFVRQLNKYDFHKVKNPEEGGSPYGEHTWEFKHPNFRTDMKDSLEHIKRKAPAARKATPVPNANRPRGPGSNIDPSLGGGDLASFQNQLDSLHRAQQGLNQHMQNLSQDYQAVIGEMMNFQRNMVAQDQLMQNLIQYLVNLEADQNNANNNQDPANFVPSSQAQKLISSYTEVARASYDQMADLSRRASLSGGTLPPIPLPPPNFGQFEMNVRRDRRDEQNGAGPAPQQPQRPDYHRADSHHQPAHQQPAHQQQQHHAPQGHQQQHAQQSHPQGPPQHPHQQDHSHQQQQAGPPASGEARRPAYVPGWAVPPRVLLVEDDAVCRKLSSKFLQVFGCSIDVAVDGVSAVNKMNMEKYDLVLMDIVMPNLDGVSATSLIRQFDPMTPIISMTSNSGPNEIMTYFSHGMNDILPKPFTKDGLLGMLEKHLIHLKVMQQMAEIPRALGFTDNQIQDALAVSVSEEGNVMNPFSGMGVSDSQYLDMLQGIALEKEGKRALEVVQGNEREGKRARFIELGGDPNSVEGRV